MLVSVGNLRDRSSPHNRKKYRYLGVISAAENGSHLAVVLSMRNKAAVDPDTGFNSFMRSSRAFAGASLVALAFGFAVFLIGLPLALGVRVVHEGLSWLARLGGETGPVAEALVSIASVVGGIMLTVVFARALIAFFRWRGALRRAAHLDPPCRVGHGDAMDGPPAAALAGLGKPRGPLVAVLW
jgi:hypothetical protein